MKNLRMSKKLIVMFVVTGLIPMLVLSFFLQGRTAEEISNGILSENSLYFALKGEEISNYYSQRAEDGLVLSSVPDVYEGLGIVAEQGLQSIEWKKHALSLNKLLNTSVKEYGFLDIYVTDQKGNVIIASEYKFSLEGKNLSENEYIQKGLSGVQNWSPISYSEYIKDNTITLSTPVYENGKSGTVVGTLNILLHQDVMDQIVHTGIERVGESGNSYLINEEGLLLTNTKQGDYVENAALEIVIDTEATKMLSDALIKQDYEFEFTDTYINYSGNKVLGSAGIVKMGDTYAALIIEVDETEALSTLDNMKNIIFIMVGIAGVLGLLSAIYFATTISKPIKAVVEQSKVIANLDISNDIPEKLVNRKDEIGDLSKALKSIVGSLKVIVSEIRVSSEQVAASSEELTATTQQSSMATEEVARTVEEIARGASDQARNTEEGSLKAVQLGETIEKDQSYIKNLTKSSQRVSDVVSEGLIEIENLTRISEESNRETKKVHDGIIKTNESANKIGEASSVIASIAEQTNLLALNAAIEAARAGEAGRGFAVVAEEIRKLAEQSTSSTQTIDEVVQELQSNSNAAVNIMEKVAVILNKQTESVNVSKTKYLTISEAIMEAQRAVEDLNMSGKEMEKVKEEILDTLQNLAAIAEENSASTQEVSASMEEQAAAIEEISSSSETLSELAQNMQSIIMKFKI
ncbi:methyl-accepting chemotaxis protein [Alkaliphilus serpentinus]|uniref:HAMP domain-containing protein n=1 Tax=Alkaliphilus serpentinus TaxID=1482731 RepID=A0A833HNX5_9FIRM|nr:methyl-accepting chemotaxis protein [Alkaliphilus serpentinus]KAB3530038.1 HAMP domain-containing protein [Alkaliphilus serpentinus]